MVGLNCVMSAYSEELIEILNQYTYNATIFPNMNDVFPNLTHWNNIDGITFTIQYLSAGGSSVIVMMTFHCIVIIIIHIVCRKYPLLTFIHY